MSGKFICDNCDMEFKYNKNLKKHKSANVCIKNINKNFKCNKCNKYFASKFVLNRHLETICKDNIMCEINNKMDKILDVLQSLQMENSKLKTEIDVLKGSSIKSNVDINKQTIPQINNITNNTTNNAINNTINGNVIVNNVTLVDFGSEDTNQLSLEEQYEILKKGGELPYMFLKLLHFNPKLPQYHNVFIPNKKIKKGCVYKNNNYMFCELESIYTEMIDKSKTFIWSNENNPLYNELAPITRKALKVFCDTAFDDSDNRDYYNRITKNMENTLLSLGKMAIEQKNKYENDKKLNSTMAKQ